MKQKLLFLNFADGIPSPNIGGPQNIIYQIIKNLDTEKLSSDVLSTSAKIVSIENCFQELSDDYQYAIKKITKGLFYKNKLYRQFVSWDYYRAFSLIKNSTLIKLQLPIEKYRIIHAHDSIGLFYSERYKNAFKIISIHNHELFSKHYSEVFINQKIRSLISDNLKVKELKALSLANFLTFPSEAVRNYYFDAMSPQLNNNYQIIYNGVDLDRIKKIEPFNINVYKEISQDIEYKLINVSRHDPQKGVMKVLEVVTELKEKLNKKVVLVCVGNGLETEKYKDYIKKHNLGRNIIFVKHASNDEVISLMKACDVFLHLPTKVVFDLVIIEALAAGLTVFSSNEGGNKEIITHGENGFLVSKELDPTSIAKMIVENRKYLNKENLINSVNTFSSINMVNQYQNLYDDILTGKISN